MRKGFEKRFENGDIVYWHRQKGNRHFVEYGMVDEQFSDAVCVDLLEFKERRLVNRIPINDFPNYTEFRKLPKNWSYNTKLYEITYIPWTEEELKILKDRKISNPQNIKELYKLGYLVKADKIFDGEIGTDITKEGYRVKKCYPQYTYNITHTSVTSDKVYFTYEEAKKEVEDYLAELKRQSQLSDYDWSVEEIDKILNRWSCNYGIPEDTKNNYREWLLELDNIEDLVVRIDGGEIQWKYDKNKKWRNIEIN